VFERFTTEARHIVVRAQEEARELNHDHIGTDHLLIALTESDVFADQQLQQFGTTSDIRKKVEARAHTGNFSPEGHIPFTGNARTILEQSLRVSLRLHHKNIGPEHLLIAILENRKCSAHKILDVSNKQAHSIVAAIEEVASRQPTYVPTDDYPTCARCERPLNQVLGHRTVESHGDDGSTLQTTLAYCRTCGATVGIIQPPGTGFGSATS